MLREPLSPPIWIDKQDTLQNLVKHLNQQNRIAVDTEANSLHAYHERVCLIQFSTPQNDYLVDPFNLVDLSPLAAIFSNPKIEKVFHAAEYDVYLLEHEYGFTFDNLFDTQIAARTLGYPATGLGSLLATHFEIKLDKHFQKANWGQRPLPENLVDYARMDTRYLLALRDILQQELVEKGRWELAHEDFHRCCYSNGHNHQDPRERWEKINGQSDLTSRQKTILHELCLTREKIAEKLDRPLFKVLDDRTLLSLAEAMPTSRQELEETGLSLRQIDRFGKPILEAIQKGQRAPLVKKTIVDRLSNATLNRINKLKTWRKTAAKELGVESDVILPRIYIHALAEQNPRTKQNLSEVLSAIPWRLKQYEQELMKALGIKESQPFPKE